MYSRGSHYVTILRKRLEDVSRSIRMESATIIVHSMEANWCTVYAVNSIADHRENTLHGCATVKSRQQSYRTFKSRSY